MFVTMVRIRPLVLIGMQYGSSGSSGVTSVFPNTAERSHSTTPYWVPLSDAIYDALRGRPAITLAGTLSTPASTAGSEFKSKRAKPPAQEGNGVFLCAQLSTMEQPVSLDFSTTKV
jgi:hypothetical protein